MTSPEDKQPPCTHLCLYIWVKQPALSVIHSQLPLHRAFILFRNALLCVTTPSILPHTDMNEPFTLPLCPHHSPFLSQCTSLLLIRSGLAVSSERECCWRAYFLGVTAFLFSHLIPPCPMNDTPAFTTLRLYLKYNLKSFPFVSFVKFKLWFLFILKLLILTSNH